MEIQIYSYEQLDREIKLTMKRSANDLVKMGYLLRNMMEERLWERQHSCFDEYLEKELHMDYTMATRFIKANKKYADGADSMKIDAKWEGLSQSVLIEMLNMPPELEEKITPDMTVKQVREVKRQAKQKMKPDIRGLMDDPYCAACGAELDPFNQTKGCVECGQTVDWEWYDRNFGDKQETVVDGEYREIREEVATSQPAETVSDKPHDESWFVGQFVESEPEKAAEMLKICRDEKCNSDRAKAIQKHISPYGCCFYSSSGFSYSFYGFSNGLDIEVGNEKIHLKYGRLVVELMKLLDERQISEAVEEPAAEVQQELPVLKNDNQRKEWLNNYKAWGIWYRDENIDVNYYKFDFADGSRLVVAEYPQRRPSYSFKNQDLHCYHMIAKGDRRFNNQYCPDKDLELYIIEFIRALQKNGNVSADYLLTGKERKHDKSN